MNFKVNILKNETPRKKSDLLFALCNSENDSENLRPNVKNYLNQIGTVYEINEECNNKADMLFCFGGDELLSKLDVFQKTNPSATIVYVGNQKKITQENFKGYINYYIDLPIYGSKIFNIIADNSTIHEGVIEQAKASDYKYEANILVAEDNLNNQKLIEILLSKIGIAHAIVSNGEEAIEAYQNGHYEMVLMDINMPVMDGVTATKEILRLQKEKGLYKAPIIALTANSVSGDREKYIEAGMDDYLSKPIEFEKLINMIKKYLTKKGTSLHLNAPESQVEIPLVEVLEYKKSDAMKQLGLNELTIDMLLDNFFLTLEDDLEKLKKAIESKNCDEIYKAAHYIKGSCANLAMNEASSLLHEIEKNANNGVCEEIDFARIVKSFENVKSYL